jgi:hypothetical protein
MGVSLVRSGAIRQNHPLRGSAGPFIRQLRRPAQEMPIAAIKSSGQGRQALPISSVDRALELFLRHVRSTFDARLAGFVVELVVRPPA